MRPAFLYFATAVSATKHILYAGTYKDSNLYALEFDTEALSLTLQNNITSAGPHSYITFSHDKKNLYAVEQTGFWNSYDVNGTNLAHTARVAVAGNCSLYTFPYIIGTTDEPYNVYAAPFSDCGNVLSTTTNGSLDTVIDTFSYHHNVSGIHGLALSPDNKFLFSADLKANSIWTHKVDSTTGSLTLVSELPARELEAGPRRASVHPGGKYLYVLLEHTSQVAQYQIRPNGTLVQEDPEYSIVPTGYNISAYKGDQVQVSASGKYVWASTRGGASGNPGYITGFSLSANGSIASQLFRLPSPSGGLAANSIAPAFFDDQWLAMAESENHSVQIWRFDQRNNSAEVVAQWVAEGDCCANAIWYS